MYVPYSQLARVRAPVTVMVLPFFTGSGAAFTVSLERRWSLKLPAFSFQMKLESWPLASTQASAYQVPAWRRWWCACAWIPPWVESVG